MQVNLKKDGWHRRLQEYIFDDPPRFGSLCPYFWFTIFCLIALPFVAIFKSIIAPICYGIYKVCEVTLRFIDENVCTPMFESQILGMSDGTLFDTYNKNYVYENHMGFYDRCESRQGKRYSKAVKRFRKFRDLWMKKNGLGEKEFKTEILAKLEEKRIANQKNKEKEEIAQAKRESENRKKAKIKEEKRQKMFANIIKYTQWIVPVVLTVVGLGLVYGLYSLLVYLSSLATTVDWAKIGMMCLYGLAIIAALAVVVGLIIVIVKIAKKCELQLPSFAWVGKFFSAVARGLRRFGGGIGNGIAGFIDFFVTYAKAAKENYCPMIKWDE